MFSFSTPLLYFSRVGFIRESEDPFLFFLSFLFLFWQVFPESRTAWDSSSSPSPFPSSLILVSEKSSFGTSITAPQCLVSSSLLHFLSVCHPRRATLFSGHVSLRALRPQGTEVAETRREGTRSVQGTHVLTGRSPLATRLPQDSKGHVSLGHVPQGHIQAVSRARVTSRAHRSPRAGLRWAHASLKTPRYPTLGLFIIDLLVS